MRIPRLFAATALALVALVLVPAPSYACSCAQSTLQEHVDRAEVVVRGTVDSREGPENARVRSSMDEVTYAVTVAEVYRGDPPVPLEVHSVESGASCGLENIRLGDEYVVFADEGTGPGNEGELWANLCGGTASATPELVAAVEAATGPGAGPPASDVPTDIPAGAVGPATPATPATTGTPGGSGSPTRAWSLGLGAAAAAALVFAVVSRRGRHRRT